MRAYSKVGFSRSYPPSSHDVRFIARQVFLKLLLKPPSAMIRSGPWHNIVTWAQQFLVQQGMHPAVSTLESYASGRDAWRRLGLELGASMYHDLESSGERIWTSVRAFSQTAPWLCVAVVAELEPHGIRMAWIDTIGPLTFQLSDTGDFETLLVSAVRYFRMSKPCFMFQLFVCSWYDEEASHTPIVSDDFVVTLHALPVRWRSDVAGIWPELRM